MSDRVDDLEDQEDALLEGDRTLEVSSARAALRVRDFRVVWLGAFASNIGTWMQNVVLGALAYDLTARAAKRLRKAKKLKIVLTITMRAGTGAPG